MPLHTVVMWTLSSRKKKQNTFIISKLEYAIECWIRKWGIAAVIFWTNCYCMLPDQPWQGFCSHEWIGYKSVAADTSSTAGECKGKICRGILWSLLAWKMSSIKWRWSVLIYRPRWYIQHWLSEFNLVFPHLCSLCKAKHGTVKSLYNAVILC